MNFARPILALLLVAPLPAAETADRQLARDLFQQLIEINTTDSTGSTTAAAEAMAKRLLDAGFPAADVKVLGPNNRRGNLVVHVPGKNPELKAVLIICHLDVVEARRSDWTTDPFQFVEKDGYFYGRGTQDVKDNDAALIADLIRLHREGWRPDRTLIVALTADEEGGHSNGVDWLLRNHRDMVDAAFALNPDAGGVTSAKGKVVNVDIEASEKLYQDFEFSATNPGGHSSLPVPDNAIYHVADALGKLEKTVFPLELNEITRTYFERRAPLESGQTKDDMNAILHIPPDPAAVARLSQDPRYNSTLRTTCVATRITGGHANNALPQLAQAIVNCRILPGHSPEEIHARLAAIVNDPKVAIRYVNDAGDVSDRPPSRRSFSPVMPSPEILKPLEKVAAEMWPGAPVIPDMETGASDSIYTVAAGIPSYGVSGMAIDQDDVRAHGKDERLRVSSFYDGVEFYYRYLKALLGGAK
ncbi:MAG TPA: M20/M25/M40 family metallo-hydrolase [Bryobacteraceae bacterium]|nr:M20/M25/M40 family metallo-hydrolase [Bryobacteraceae bacterium]